MKKKEKVEHFLDVQLYGLTPEGTVELAENGKKYIRLFSSENDAIKYKEGNKI